MDLAGDMNCFKFKGYNRIRRVGLDFEKLVALAARRHPQFLSAELLSSTLLLSYTAMAFCACSPCAAL
jgi:hypothetical protein